MGRDDEKKSKKHKKEKDNDRDDGRERKRTRREKDELPEREADKHRRRSISPPISSKGGVAPDPISRSPAPPQGIKPAVEDTGGESSMSIEETNRVRASLGLKPLQVGTNEEKERAAHAAKVAAKEEEQRKLREVEVAERIQAQKERRVEQEKLRKVKTLGEAGEDVDDLSAWVSRNKKAEERAKAEARAKAAKVAKQLEEQEEQDSEEEDLQNGRELAGMKVRHDADELNEGETMILTLADRGILDDRGDIREDAEELENVLVTEDKVRRRAAKAATKTNKPLFGEDGKTRGLLEKYDEEDEEGAGMSIDAEGLVEAAKQKRQADIRQRLAESAATASKQGFATQGDFFTAEEMAQFSKPKTKKKRKIRKKGADEEEAGLDISALEAAAGDGSKDRGSRSEKATRDAVKAAADAAKLQERRDRYDNALNKANTASLVLQPSAGDADEEDGGGDDVDDDLQASLERARRAARAKEEKRAPNDDLAAETVRRREQREQRLKEEGGLQFSEAKDFANSIQLVKVEEPAEEAQPGEMHEEEAAPAPTPLPPPPPAPKPAPQTSKYGSWVPADKVKEEEDEEMPDAQEASKEEQEENLVREKNVGAGLAGAMELLRGRGELQQKTEWAGRTNDMKGGALQGLEEVYAGGRHTDRIAANIEQALTQRDEFGRIMTPKERFRDLCHNFHGKTISKGKQEKRLRKMTEEMEARKAATGEGSINAFSKMGGQHVAGTPYTVLSGNLQPGQSSDPASGFSTVEGRAAPTPLPGSLTPMLGGSETPLVGDRKVEVMLGMRRESAAASGSMAPPAPRSVRK